MGSPIALRQHTQTLSGRARTAGFSSCLHSAPPPSDSQLRTRRTLLDSWVWLDATEGGLGASCQWPRLIGSPKTGSSEAQRLDQMQLHPSQVVGKARLAIHDWLGQLHRFGVAQVVEH